MQTLQKTEQQLRWPGAGRWSDEERQEANENLRQYVALALRVFELLESDPELAARLHALTALRNDHNMKTKETQNNNPPQE